MFLKPGPQKVLEERRAAVLLAAGRKLISFIKMVVIRRQFLRTREATVILQRCTATAGRCRESEGGHGGSRVSGQRRGLCSRRRDALADQPPALAGPPPCRDLAAKEYARSPRIDLEDAFVQVLMRTR